MDEIRLIDANALKIELTQQIAYFGDRANTTSIENEKYAYSHCKDGLMLARQMVDNAPTVEYPFYQEAYQTGYEEGKNERPHGEWIVKVERRGFYAGDKTVYSYTCPFCGKMEFDAYEFCHCGADMRPEKKLQTPSCLTNPERQAELLERYKEE